jgi:hypothetical protein
MELCVSYKIDEGIAEHEDNNLCLPHHCSFIPQNWFGSSLRQVTNSNIDRNVFGIEAVKKKWEESLEQVCMFVFVH